MLTVAGGRAGRMIAAQLLAYYFTELKDDQLKKVSKPGGVGWAGVGGCQQAGRARGAGGGRDEVLLSV